MEEDVAAVAAVTRIKKVKPTAMSATDAADVRLSPNVRVRATMIKSKGMNETLTPAPLRKGDKIAIIAPASVIAPELVTATLPLLEREGWRPYVGPHTFDRYGNFAGTDADRLSDLKAALLDPDTRAILCARGGFGAVHLIEGLSHLPLREDPKWIIGFSDISALHALLAVNGIESIHSPMCRHLVREGATDSDSQRLFDILRGHRAPITFDINPLNRPGTASGQLLGGNLAVLSALLSTPFNIIKPGSILFIEDISEQVYKVDRILHTLKLNGTLPRLGALLVGQFTNYTPGVDGKRMEEMIWEMVKEYHYPVAFNLPIGHIDHNVPLIVSSTVTLQVTSAAVTLAYA